MKLNEWPGHGASADGTPSRIVWRMWPAGWRPPSPTVFVNTDEWLPGFGVQDGDRADWVRRYAEWIDAQPDLIELVRRRLGGKHLACFCGMDQPCHADVLLRVANNLQEEDQQ